MTKHQQNPFFIVGCMRSGTTMVRDILRCHPDLAAPEETQFYRWTYPFGSNAFAKLLTNNATLQKHRQLDHIEEREFLAILHKSVSRSDLYRRYMALFLERNKPTATRWFDKSPQNVYGSAMMAMEFPKAKFIHIVRNPLDVVSSLRIGKIVKIENLVGACNSWNESLENFQMIKRAFPRRIYEIKYEDFTREPLAEIEKLADFLDEKFDPDHYRHIRIETKRHEHASLFSDAELRKAALLCRRWGAHYGYSAAPEPAIISSNRP